ncbi:hypothetical protein [Mycolicibacterium houstonense]|uniref:hypothetical protein n=1 Tax=Mycolicibacterium houstonense TaxID=146021 RepID=UPI00135A34E3|nr:hypothetical protein [Mycolicibacterium houstonense]
MTRAQRSPAISIAESMTGVARGWTAKGTLVVPVPGVPLDRDRRDGGLWHRAVATVRAALAAAPRLKRPYYPPLREGFVEDAAMAREMWRL